MLWLPAGFALSEAVALVQKRGQYMTEAAPQGTGKMVAVMNAERELRKPAKKPVLSELWLQQL